MSDIHKGHKGKDIHISFPLSLQTKLRKDGFDFTLFFFLFFLYPNTCMENNLLFPFPFSSFFLFSFLPNYNQTGYKIFIVNK